MRKKTIKDIEKYIKVNNGENIAQLKMLIDLIDSDKNIFIREKISGTIDIASNMLLFNKDKSKLLCLWHKKIQAWTFPGGHCDGNENIQKVAHIELEEETGVTGVKIFGGEPLHIQRFDYDKSVYGYSKSIFGFFYASVIPEGQHPEIMELDKCEKMKWFSREEFGKLINDDKYGINKAILDKWLE